MSRKPRRFHVIDGSEAPDTPLESVRRRLRAMPKPPKMMQCPRCAGREIIETRCGATRDSRRSGVREYLCVLCLMRGERVVVQ